MTLNGYINLLRGVGRADKTIRTYVGVVRRLMAWCADHQLDPVTIAPHDVRTWADTLPLTYASRKAAAAALRHYWQHRPDEPWKAVRVPAKPRERYTGLTVDEAVQFTAAARLHGGRPGTAALCLMLTGARAIEVAGFHHDHIDRHTGVISWWRPKTQDWHVMPLHPPLAAAIPDGAGFLFAGDGGRQHVTAQTINAWCHKVAELAGLHVTPQKVRSTAAMLVVKATSDIEAAATVLGHRDLNTTRRHYTVQVDGARIDGAMAGFGLLDEAS